MGGCVCGVYGEVNMYNVPLNASSACNYFGEARQNDFGHTLAW